jgi:hypothetical protein
MREEDVHVGVRLTPTQLHDHHGMVASLTTPQWDIPGGPAQA